MRYILVSDANNFFIDCNNKACIMPDFFFVKISDYTPLIFYSEEGAAMLATGLNEILKTRGKIADIKPRRIA